MLAEDGKRVPYHVGDLLQRAGLSGARPLGVALDELRRELTVEGDARLGQALERLGLARRLNGHLLALCRKYQARIRELEAASATIPAPRRGRPRKAGPAADPLEGLEELDFEREL